MSNIGVLKKGITRYKDTAKPQSPVEALNNFFAFLDVSPKTADTYRKALKQFMNYLNEHEIMHPQREDIIAFRKNLDCKGRKPATIALYLSAVRRFFSWCKSEGLYEDITVGIKAPKIDRGHKKDCFSGSQVRDILRGINRRSLEGMRNYAILGLMVTCGLRTIEITRADVGDLRNVAGVTCLFIQGKGKTSKADFVKLPPQIERAVRDYLSSRGTLRDDEPLFSSCSRRNNGKRLTTRTISGVAKSAMNNAGFYSSRLTAHSLRHTAITLALIAGQSLSDVQAFARHCSITTTMIYNHAVNRMKSRCEATISNAIFNCGR
jgi:integrase/recombinase XerC